MKSPHKQRPDDIARADTERFIERYAARTAAKTVAAKARSANAGKARSSTKK
jgi:hypothetical protein